MKIAITGCAGSHHKEIAKLLAERLTLQCFTADMFINIPECDYPPSTEDYDILVNTKILNTVLSADDYVLDSLISFTVPNTVKIYIDRDITEEVLYPTSILESMIKDSQFLSKYCFETQHDIYINRTTISDEDIVQLIVDILVTGSSGDFVPLNLCLPHKDFIQTCVEKFDSISAAYVGKYNNLFILKQAIIGETNLSRKFIKVVQIDSTNEDLEHPSFFIDWFDKLDNKDVLMLNLMLNRYCLREGLDDVREVYVKLMHNGNALSKLMELEGGY